MCVVRVGWVSLSIIGGQGEASQDLDTMLWPSGGKATDVQTERDR